MPGVRTSSSRALLAVAAAALLGATGCGADQETTYATGWDGVCRDVGSALSTFRTAASSAATTSPDTGGDDADGRGPAAAAVTADLLRPARSLDAALRAPLADAARLDPPKQWAAWHAAELRRLAVRQRAVDEGVRRLQVGDADALPLLAIGSVGPASVDAPAALRDRTPDCTVLR